MTLRRIASLLAWLLFGVIAYSTLSPIGMRPHIGTWVHVERFGAFGLLGLLFMIGYPRRLPFVIAIVLGTAVGFELLQMLSMDRHARWGDLAVKLAGGSCGIAAGCLLARINQNANYPG
ncbi:VanZ family protein [Sinorhizobium garamanticum]|uniref:VanZ family protein n=1 Tax=Sinorhizobium garamanticum TaxID=680247 RepID=A0ABY8DCN3_9HYPH|nr:VanZ family protein [Sinorhizobium garamanticum]WEX88638.1 VanZ family protein [Sinorhizobium garamanticum]